MVAEKEMEHNSHKGGKIKGKSMTVAAVVGKKAYLTMSNSKDTIIHLAEVIKQSINRKSS